MIKILYILIAILMLGVIVTIHEFGHYLAGRLCGIGILAFSIGFGPKLVQFKRKGILYSLRAIPLGGYCSFVGEDENDDAPNAMNKQPVWKRFITVLSGPLMNFVLAFVACTLLLCNFYVAEYLPRISFIAEDMPATECGLEVGDVLLTVNGTPISFDQAGVNAVASTIQASDLSEPIALTILRDGSQFDLSVLPQAVSNADGSTSYQIGIGFGARTFRPGEALGRSCGYMVDFTKAMLQGLKDMIFGKVQNGSVMGPVGIISYVSDIVYSEKLYGVVYYLFVLSLNVGIMNLLPLPALDGGRLIFLLIEAIRGKPIPPEKEGMVHAAGFMLLLLVIVFVTYKDIVRLITGG